MFRTAAAETVIAADAATDDNYSVLGGATAASTPYVNIDLGYGNDHLTVDYSAATVDIWMPASSYPFRTGGVDWEYGVGGTMYYGPNGARQAVLTFAGVDRITIFGGSGNDRLDGTIKDDQLYGGAGDDQLHAGVGTDLMVGGAGNDSYIVDSDDTVVENFGEGIDHIETPAGSKLDPSAMYQLPANVENLTGTGYYFGQGVYGNALDNVIKMAASSDLVVLQDGGNDRVEAGAGDDFLYWGAAFNNADSNHGGEGFDSVGLLGNYSLILDADDLVSIEKLAVYSSGNPAQPASYALTTHDANVLAGQQLLVIGSSLTGSESLSFDGSAELDGFFKIRSGRGADTLIGGAKRDDIQGGEGNDLIRGNGGKDSVQGGLGADELWGGEGADRFVYTGTAESPALAAGTDWIKDFEVGVDKIHLRPIDANGNAADGLTAFSFIGGSAFSGTAGELRVISNGSASFVQADINGDGNADFAIQVTTTSIYPLGRNDFEI
ncbi:MAG TPA: calcium-binding protein [Allosphingosinicella sp.]|jgi:Ca2+-binding RTX toxin-like protein